MSADMAIDYTDDRKDLWIPVGPQSYLNDWRPLARQNQWESIERLCDNRLQVFDHEAATQLLDQLQELLSVLRRRELASCDDERQESMVSRLEPLVLHIADAAYSWDGVKMISIG
jgi:hypothetical protein